VRTTAPDQSDAISCSASLPFLHEFDLVEQIPSSFEGELMRPFIKRRL
jgi:hypothetical protein